MLEIKCPACNHIMEFETVSGNLKCNFCSFNTHITDIDLPEYGSYQKSSYINEMITDADNDISALNAGTQNLTVNKKKEYICPVLSKDDICVLLRKWAGKSIFTEKSFNDALNSKNITLSYVPAYAFEVTASETLEGAASKNDDEENNTCRITRTHYYNITHRADINNYHKVLSASDAMSDIVLENILPYNYNDTIEYNDKLPENGTAFNITKAASGLYNDISKTLAKYMHDTLKNSIEEYSSIYNYNITEHTENASARTIYIPIWKLNYTSKGYEQSVYINAQNGLISGKDPVSSKRIALYFLITGILTAALAVSAILFI